MITASLPEDLPDSEEIYIFGAGRGCQIMLGLLGKIPGARVLGVIDNKKSGTFCGFPVMSLDRFKEIRTDNSVIIISSMYFQEISIQLLRGGVGNFCNGYPVILRKIERDKKIKTIMCVFLVVVLVFVFLKNR